MAEDRFVVTGAGGFVGQAVARKLTERGSVLGIGRTAPAQDWPNYEAIGTDLSRQCPDYSAFRGATVIHSAALMNSISRDELWAANVEATRIVFEWAVKHSAKQVILISTGGVYGYSENHAAAETDRIEPIGFYGHTKWIAEQMAHAYADCAQLPVSVVRLFFPYGPGQTRGIVPFIQNAIRNGQPLSLHRGGAPRINPVHIDDVVTAVESLLEPEPGVRVVNLCGDEVLSFADLVQLFEREIGRPAIVQQTDTPHGDLFGANTLLKSHYHWSPRRRLAS